MSEEIAIRVQNLTKTYRLYASHFDRLKEVLHPSGRKFSHEFHALNDVNFEVKKGETVGIIGKNGSGKSTLLKILTGVLTPTNGLIILNGKVSALLELGAGFNPMLTGIENVYFNGTLMGHSKEEIENKLDDILSFADIGEFINQPVKMYSSGMFVRLAFAVAICVEPEILIVDEALSVGDIFFQQKCYTKIKNKIADGITCLFVSHDTSVIANLCNRAILLENGNIAQDGNTESVISKFLTSTNSRLLTDIERITIDYENGENKCNSTDIIKNNILKESCIRSGAGGLVIKAVRVVDEINNDTLYVEMYKTLTFSILLEANQYVSNPSAGIQIRDRLGNLIFGAGTRQLGLNIPNISKGSKLIIQLNLKFNLQAGEYTFALGAAEPSGHGPNDGYFHDLIDSLGPIKVHMGNQGIMPFFGIVSLPLEASYSVE